MFVPASVVTAPISGVELRIMGGELYSAQAAIEQNNKTGSTLIPFS
jgi:hypothetical protein